MPQLRNIRVNGPVDFTNKENQNRVAHGPIFAPDPMLSSTLLNDSLEVNDHILADQNDSKPTAIQISINSSCESGASRKVTYNRSSPKASIPKIPRITFNSNNNNGSSKSNNNNSPSKPITSTPIRPVPTSRPTKRKADNSSANVKPAKKKNVSDVIVLDDTTLDVDQADDDSVVFVSETMVSSKQHAMLARSPRQRAANYIPIGENSSTRKSPRSVRAQRRKEKKDQKRLQKQHKVQANQQRNGKFKIPKKNSRPKSVPVDGNRFDLQNPSTSFGSLSSSLSTTPINAGNSTTATQSTRKSVIKRELKERLFKEKPELFEKRMIIIDGSNVAHSHGPSHTYSIKGIELCIKYFENLGYSVKAVVPQMRQKRSKSSDPDALQKLIKANKILETPCKNLPGKRSTSYDDRFILDAAVLKNGAIISNDNYADLLNEKEDWDEIINERVVGFTWLDDFIMIPNDPYGKNGPSLQMILHKLKDDAQVDDSYRDTSDTNATENEASVIICDNSN